VRVLRLVEYEGPRKEIEEQLKNSIHGTRTMRRALRITATDLGRFPEVIEEARRVADPSVIQELNARIEKVEMERDKALGREDELRARLHQSKEKLGEMNDLLSLMNAELRFLWSGREEEEGEVFMMGMEAGVEENG
jgi:chromosome segregation ATPase